ncbi:hypothetical protein BJX61DRAFT_311650 [Aspergillus egyptiacus]|nr:hypothetical protein BJX61DRAFT_311650 [Aspergillus egyptiacus]
MATKAAAMPVPIPHRYKGENPQKKVDDLVRKYQVAGDPSPVMLEILNDPDGYAVLVGALRRQVSLAKCRSQDFDDCQITVYDKALLILSNYGESVTDPRALELYLTEFLGIVPIASATDGKEALYRHIELHGVLDRAHERKAAAASKEYKREPEVSSNFDIHDEYERYFSKAGAIEEEEVKFTDQPEKDIRVVRLLDVYRQAKEDYFSTKERDGLDSLSAVRFLRDSAENALRYLRTNGLQNHSCMPDLERTFAIARDKTAQLLGGRKRHFDEDHHRASRIFRRKRARRILDSYRPRGDSGY